MAETTFTFRVDDELKKQFAEIAKAKDRTGAQLLRDFMRETILREEEAAEYDAWYRAKVQKGLDELDAGLGIPHEEVEAYFAELRKDLLRQDRLEKDRLRKDLVRKKAL